MKRSLHAARRARPMSRAVWWASSGTINKTLAQRYGDGRRVTTQPFQRSVTDEAPAEMAGAARVSTAEVVTLAPPPFPVRMLRNLSFGPTPATIAEFNALGSTNSRRLAN